MKKIYDSPFNSWDERAEMIIIYELEEDEYFKLFEEYQGDFEYSFDYERMLHDLGYSDEYNVLPGAIYTQYTVIDITTHHLIISRHDALNI